MQMISFWLSGVFTIALIFTSGFAMKILISGVIYVAMNSGNSVLYTYTQELYPPLQRGGGVGWATGICNITGVLAPIAVTEIGYLLNNSMVLGFIGACFFVAGVFPMFLPDSRNKDLPKVI